MDLPNKHLHVCKIFAAEYTLPFKLLIILLIFSRIRPDRLIAGGNFLTHFPTIVLFILGLHWLINPKKVLYNIQTKIILALGAFMIIQIPLVRNSYEALSFVKSFLVFTLTGYLVKVQFIDNLFKLHKYITLMVISSIFFAVLGITGKGLVSIPLLGDENDFCLFMNTLIPFAFFMGQETDNNKKKVLYYSILFLFVLANITTFSRGGFVGLLAVGVFLLHRSKKKIAYIFLMLIILSSMIHFAPTGYWDEIKTIRTEGTIEGTGKQRVELWKAGWKMFLDHPVMGVGPGNYGIWLPEYYTHDKPWTMWGRAAHSLYVTLLSEMGVVGTFFFLLILWWNYKDYRYIANLEKKIHTALIEQDIGHEETNVMKNLVQNLQLFSYSTAGAMVAYLATGVFISVLWYWYFWVFTSFLVITGNIGRNLEKEISTMRQIQVP